MKMKRTVYLGTVIGLVLTVSYGIACPTCIGRVEKHSPAFFSDDAYDPTAHEDENVHREDVINHDNTTSITQEDRV